MSAIPAITLLCNDTGCYQHAVIIGAIDPTEARGQAATRGWTSSYHQGHQHEHDHCPKHSQPPKQSKKKRTLSDKLRDLARPASGLAPLPALSPSLIADGFVHRSLIRSAR
ncbi:hypothetical protein AB0G05_19805 [Nonomuraea wenchangensis]